MFDNKKIILTGLLLTLIGCILSAKITNDLVDNPYNLPEILYNMDDTEDDLHNLQKILHNIDNSIKAKCRKTTGNDTAYQNLKNATFSLIGCKSAIIAETLIESFLMVDFKNVSVSGVDGIIFKNSCEKREAQYGCLKNFFDKLELCAAPNEIENPKLLFEMSKNSMDFFCEENGKQYDWIRDENNCQSGTNCIENYKEDIWSCLKNSANVDLKMITIEDIMNKIFSSTEQICREMTGWENCLMGAINKCNTSSLTEFFNALATSLRKNTACENLIESNHELNNIDPTVNKV